MCVEGKIEEARELCERIVSIQPDLLEIQYLLAQCLYYLINESLGQENLRQADSIMKYLRKQCPADEEVLILYDHTEEMKYVKETYPHSWGMAEKCINRIQGEPETYQKEMVTQMLGLIQSRRDIADRTVIEEKIISGLNDLYEDAVNTKKEPVRIDSGTTFHCGEAKPGRNDPCPCDSGKNIKSAAEKGYRRIY